MSRAAGGVKAHFEASIKKYREKRAQVFRRANLAELCNPLVLNLPEWNQPEEFRRLVAVFRWLSEYSGWLMILDNADTPEAAL